MSDLDKFAPKFYSPSLPGAATAMYHDLYDYARKLEDKLERIEGHLPANSIVAREQRILEILKEP